MPSLARYPVYATHRIVEDSTMDTRRHRAQSLAQFRWLGWVMLMMFVLVQAAQGSGGGPKVDRSSAPTGSGRTHADQHAI